MYKLARTKLKNIELLYKLDIFPSYSNAAESKSNLVIFLKMKT